MNKKSTDVVVVIPVGPGTSADFLLDTIESFIFYSLSNYEIIISDDSQQDIGNIAKERYPEVHLLRSKKPGGSMAGLYINLAEAYHYAIDNFDFKVLFKLDTDALIIGKAPEKEAIAFFENHPTVGIAGQYPNDYDGDLWDMGWPRARIMNGTMTWKFARRPIANIILRKLYFKALRNNYRTGESVFGGAYFMSYEFINELKKNKMLPNSSFRSLNLGEDHLFGLLAAAYGFKLGNLSSGNLPFACAWRGLPASPDQLMKEGKKIIHSTRSWKEIGEADIRNYFLRQRLQLKNSRSLNSITQQP